MIINKEVAFMWKKYLTILFVFCFLLTGCEKRDENTENMDQSFMEKIINKTDSDTLDKPKDNLLPEDFFNSEGFEDKDFANFCLSSIYDSPKNVDLEELFYNGFGLEIDASDRNFIEKQKVDMDFDIIKLPATEMDRILKKYFGITLEESNWVGIQNFYHNTDENIYYLVHSDSHQWCINVLDQYIDEAGNINMIYSKLGGNERYRAVVKKEGENYIFHSNQLYTASIQ